MLTIAWPRAAHRAVIMSAVLAAALGCAGAEPRAQEVSPEVESRSDQLDVPWVPTGMKVLEAMLGYAKPTRNDYVIDLGSGDGRIVITAAKAYGASGHGVDLNEGLVQVANARAAKEGVADRAKFYVRDLFKEDISKATIITMYLLPEVVIQLRERLFNLKPGTRIVSHDYHMADWRFDAARVIEGDGGGADDVVYYWVVPAKVAGQWAWTIDYPEETDGPRKFEAFIAQRFQDIEGRAQLDLQQMRIHDAKVTGGRIAFSVTGEVGERIIRHDFRGTVEGNRIRGTVKLSGGVPEKTVPWSAFRLKADN